ncbi:DUF4474 domain-containing protein [Desulfosporosinus sp. PR]|uniref:DUF4474 domain-containing protein n=1 Tax=Candidatus Desulfosporosinus nitrosoreducens TaxID=3401928 RepID=UPI0027FB0A9B|nr:DUF4474 domain-containing protein [Desulfosporosinus sp. PR]MDQ7094055.1 DUF4474 domain-containing protein [Desulfosporosinus sp. PR]
MSEQINIFDEEPIRWDNYKNFGALPEETGIDALDEIIEITGYSYDPEQDIFYSNMDPWQRKIGYRRFFDEAAAPTGMIIDCEPITFQYNNKEWLIGFWKGQYDLVTGSEIGVYTKSSKRTLSSLIFGTLYQSATNDELLQMSSTLKKNGKELFTRQDKHWWLTGFKLGEFSQPSELTMEISVTLQDQTMCAAFIKGLNDAGYSEQELRRSGLTVSFEFNTPHTPQPLTRTKALERIVQWKNEQLCNMFQEITGSSTTLPEKLKILEQLSPNLYNRIIDMGRSKPLYNLQQTLLAVSIALLIIIIGAVCSIYFLKS